MVILALTWTVIHNHSAIREIKPAVWFQYKNVVTPCLIFLIHNLFESCWRIAKISLNCLLSISLWKKDNKMYAQFKSASINIGVFCIEEWRSGWYDGIIFVVPIRVNHGINVIKVWATILLTVWLIVTAFIALCFNSV